MVFTIIVFYLYIVGHTEKIYFVVFHPLAKDILASASYDMTIRIWNLSEQEEVYSLTGHTDTVSCLIIVSFIVLDNIETTFMVDV